MTVVSEGLTLRSLADGPEAMGAWVAAQLGDRFRYLGNTGQASAWRRRYGTTWVAVDHSVPLSAALAELEHAYYQLLGDESFPTSKLVRLTDARYIEYVVMAQVRNRLLVPDKR